MCDFKPGDEVVCVDASASRWTIEGFAPPLSEGATYVVADVFDVRNLISGTPSGQIGVSLVGLAWSVKGICGAWSPTRFRKVQRRDLSAWLATTNTIEEPKRTPTKAPA